MPTMKDVRALALDLPAEERARLAHELIVSLDADTDDPAEVQAAWLQEVESRLQDIDDGTVELVDWPEVRRRVMERLGRT
jgi:putative addiction module component (TIGR02574 family)